MNITRTHLDDLNAVISVDISKEDYRQKVDETLKKHRKSANIPGFRKGHVPIGLIKKQYEKAIIIEQVNQLMQESVSKYISEQQLNLIGRPLPRPGDIDWNADSFTFEFEIGLAPDFELNPGKEKFSSYEIIPSEKEIEDHIKDLTEKYGEKINQQKATEQSIISVVINEPEEGETPSDMTEIISMNDIKSSENKSKFMEASLGDNISIGAKDLALEDVILKDLTSNQTEEKPLGEDVSLTIKEIYYLEPHAVNQELFDKVFGEKTINSEEEFKEKVENSLKEQYKKPSDTHLFNTVMEKIIEQTKFNLPKDFLIRLTKELSKENKTEDTVEEEYKETERFLRNDLITSKLIKENNITISDKEIDGQILNSVKSFMAAHNIPIDENRMEEFSKNFLNDQNQRKQARENLLTDKLTAVFKNKIDFEVKKICFSDFIELLKEERDQKQKNKK